MGTKSKPKKSSQSRSPNPARKKPSKTKVADAAIGPLPEIDFSDISTTAERLRGEVDELLSDAPKPGPQFMLPPLPEVTEKSVRENIEKPCSEKRSFFSRIFGKRPDIPPAPPKQMGEDASPTDNATPETSTAQAMEMEDAPQAAQAQNVPTQDRQGIQAQEDHTRRYAHYLDNLHRRIDHEMRERKQQVSQVESELDAREKKINDMEDKLLKREMDMMQQQKQYDELVRLRQELEDKEITVNAQKAKLDELRTELQKKEKSLSRLESKLAHRQQELEDARRMLKSEQDKEKSTLQRLKEAHEERDAYKKQVDEEDEAISYLSKEMQAHDEHFAIELEDLKDRLTEKSVPKPSGRQVSESGSRLYAQLEDLLSQARSAVDDGDREYAKMLYGEIRAAYGRIKAIDGADVVLYHRILDLYNAICTSE